jgi:hypothetical protein
MFRVGSHRLRKTNLLLGFFLFACVLAYARAPQWKVFSNRAGWSIRYPAGWSTASCNSCTDPAAPEVFVDFFPPKDRDSGWVLIQHLGDKPRGETIDAWFTQVKQTANLNPLLKEERFTLNRLPALRVRYRNDSGRGYEMEEVYVVCGSRTFEIGFGGDKEGLALEAYANYPIYVRMVETFNVKR